MSILKLQAKYGLEDSSVAQPDEELTQQFEEDVETAVDPDEEVEVVDIAVSVEALNATGITAGLDYHDRAVEDELTAMDDVQSAMVAVEAYLGLLENREQRNLALTDDVATAMRIGLESIDANFFSNVAVSLENRVAIRDREPEGHQDQYWQQYGLSMDDYLHMTQQSKEDYKELLRPQAEKQVKVYLTIKAVIEAEDLELTDEDKKKAISSLAEDTGLSEEQVAEQIKGNVNVENSLLQEKAIRFLADNATAIAPEEAEDAEEDEATEEE